MRRLLGGIAMVGALGCAGEGITRYTGSAMNDAVPDSAGTLRLTLYAHSDTSFNGIVELGPPLTGGGAAYAWHDGTELKVVTVGAAEADTIFWRSGDTGANIGGRYEITGGPHKGQGGTWRARLAGGPPVSPATLRQARRLPLPQWTALWPLLAVAITLVAASRWIRRAPLVGREPTADASPSRPGQSLAGISGWLALFLFGQAMALLMAIVNVIKLPASLSSGFRIGSVIPTMQSLLVLETVVHLLIPLSIAAGIVLIVRRDRRAPRFWFAYLILSAVYLALDLAAGQYLNGQIARLLGSDPSGAATAAGGSTVSTIRQIVFTALWSLYWAHSLRVRATFGAAALDAPAPSAERRPAPEITAGILPRAGDPAA